LFLVAVNGNKDVCENAPSDNCITFTVSQGCAWMCNYCANQLGTNNYYFTDNVVFINKELVVLVIPMQVNHTHVVLLKFYMINNIKLKI
jgi:hypothetical protein